MAINMLTDVSYKVVDRKNGSNFLQDIKTRE